MTMTTKSLIEKFELLSASTNNEISFLNIETGVISTHRIKETTLDEKSIVLYCNRKQLINPRLFGFKFDFNDLKGCTDVPMSNVSDICFTLGHHMFTTTFNKNTVNLQQ